MTTSTTRRPGIGTGRPPSARELGTVTATTGQRLGSFAIDLAAVVGAGISTGLATRSTLLGAVVALELIVGLWIWQARSGLTFGKRALGLRTLRAEQRLPLGPRRAFTKFAVLGAGGLVAVLGAVIVELSTAWDTSPARQGWHDRASRSITVVARGRADTPAPATAGIVTRSRSGSVPDAPPPGPPTPAPHPPGMSAPSTVPGSESAWTPRPIAPAGPIPVAGAPEAPAPHATRAPATPPSPPRPPAGPPPNLSVGPVTLNPPAPGAPTPFTPPPAPNPPAPGIALPAPFPPVAPPGPMPSRVEIQLRDGTRHVLATPGRTVVGRRPTALGPTDHLLAVPGQDRAMSRSHLLIEADATGTWITDLGSANGSWIMVDGAARRIAAHVRIPAELPSELRLGDLVLRLIRTFPQESPGVR